MVKETLLALISVYHKVFSPLTPLSCRFYPSCSIYTHEAIQKWGIWKGCILGLKRVLRCHPFHPGGVDLVP